eukprot:944873-Ditylum_brightwellii.AAC.1
MEHSRHRDNVNAKIGGSAAAAAAEYTRERLEIFKMVQDDAGSATFAPHATNPARFAIFVDPLNGTSCYTKGDFGSVRESQKTGLMASHAVVLVPCLLFLYYYFEMN